MRILLIEDERLTAKDLAKTIVSIDPDAEIVATIASVEEGIAFLKTASPPDLIFSDIQLGDGLSFEIFEATNCTTPIIFCTAYDEYALEAFKTAGVAYLLKPFSRVSVEAAMQKFIALKKSLASPVAEGDVMAPDFSVLLGELRRQLGEGRTPSVIVHQGEKIIPVDSSTVALFAVHDDGVCAYTFDGRQLPVSQKLDALAELLGVAFFRANRQHLVARRAVRDAAHSAHRKMLINLTVPFPEPVVVGKLKTAAFLEWLAGR